MSDAAAYDPDTDEWRPIADVPVPLTYGPAVVLGGAVYLLGQDRYTDPAGDPAPYYLRYEPAADRWVELPTPPRAENRYLIVLGDRLVAYMYSHERETDGPQAARPGGPNDIPDVVWDPDTETWSDLPRDPIALSFDRSMFTVGPDLYLTGIDLVPNPGSDENPAVKRGAVFRDGQWQLLPGRDGEIGCRSIVTEGVDHADGSALCYRHPQSGEWRDPPNPPDTGPGGLSTWTWADGRFIAEDAVFDPRTEQWALAAPPRELGEREGISTIWAGDRLFAFGGATVDGESFDAYDDATLHRDAWTWEPPS
jgi:hypothetical protein